MKKEQKKSPATCCSLLTDTIAVTVLNFCVRDGYRCVHRAIVTRLFFLKDNLSKLDMDLFYYNFLTNTIQILGLLVSVSSTYHYAYTPDLSTS